jgi:hypothetical protein
MFRTIVETRLGKKAGAVLLLIGVAVGAVGAQTIPALFVTQYVTTGLFTVREGESVAFNVSLDEARSSQVSSTVNLRLYNAAGTIVTSRQVRLAPGQSAILPYRTPGRYRAHAEVLEPGEVFSSRRIVVGTVEIGRVDDLTAPIRFACSGGEVLDVGRP